MTNTTKTGPTEEEWQALLAKQRERDARAYYLTEARKRKEEWKKERQINRQLINDSGILDALSYKTPQYVPDLAKQINRSIDYTAWLLRTAKKQDLVMRMKGYSRHPVTAAPWLLVPKQSAKHRKDAKGNATTQWRRKTGRRAQPLSREGLYDLFSEAWSAIEEAQVVSGAIRFKQKRHNKHRRALIYNAIAEINRVKKRLRPEISRAQFYPPPDPITKEDMLHVSRAMSLEIKKLRRML